MNRLEFIVATSIVLFAAFGLGWFSYWILHRFSPIGAADMNEVDRLAQALHEAEEAREEALIHIEQREADLANQIAQTEAELRTAMEGLRNARQEAEEMRAYIDRLNAS